MDERWTMTQSNYARFQIGDVCLYKGHRYTIVCPIWVDPHPGYFTWHIERIMEHSETLEMPHDPLTILKWIEKNGIIQTRDDVRYQSFNVCEDDLEGEDDPPTWDYVDELRTRNVQLEEALKLRYRSAGDAP